MKSVLSALALVGFAFGGFAACSAVAAPASASPIPCMAGLPGAASRVLLRRATTVDGEVRELDSDLQMVSRALYAVGALSLLRVASELG